VCDAGSDRTIQELAASKFLLTNNLQGEIIDVKDDDRSDNEEKTKIKNKSNLSFSAYQSQGFKTFADSYFYS